MKQKSSMRVIAPGTRHALETGYMNLYSWVDNAEDRLCHLGIVNLKMRFSRGGHMLLKIPGYGFVPGLVPKQFAIDEHPAMNFQIEILFVTRELNGLFERQSPVF